jgi:hypothetical protein
MTRGFKFDLLLTFSLALIYYLLNLAFIYFPALGDGAANIFRTLHLNPDGM